MIDSHTVGFLEKIFGKTAQLTVLEYLLHNKDNDTYLSGIATETGLSHSTVSRPRVKERSFNLPPNKKERLLAPTLLRTVRESFPS